MPGARGEVLHRGDARHRLDDHARDERAHRVGDVGEGRVEVRVADRGEGGGAGADDLGDRARRRGPSARRATSASHMPNAERLDLDVLADDLRRAAALGHEHAVGLL